MSAVTVVVRVVRLRQEPFVTMTTPPATELYRWPPSWVAQEEDAKLDGQGNERPVQDRIARQDDRQGLEGRKQWA